MFKFSICAVALSCVLSSSAFAWVNDVIFKESTPYSSEDQKRIEVALRELCPDLFDVSHRADFQEVHSESRTEKIDQMMFETFYSTIFGYETDEGSRFNGTVTLTAYSSYTKHVLEVTVVDDSANLCTQNKTVRIP